MLDFRCSAKTPLAIILRLLFLLMEIGSILLTRTNKKKSKIKQTFFSFKIYLFQKVKTYCFSSECEPVECRTVRLVINIVNAAIPTTSLCLSLTFFFFLVSSRHTRVCARLRNVNVVFEHVQCRNDKLHVRLFIVHFYCYKKNT